MRIVRLSFLCFLLLLFSCNKEKKGKLSIPNINKNSQIQKTDKEAHYFIPSYSLDKLSDFISLSTTLSNYYYEREFLLLLRAHINEYYQLQTCKDPKFYFLAGIEALSSARINESQNHLNRFVNIKDITQDNYDEYFLCEDTTFNKMKYFQQMHINSNAFHFAEIILKYLNATSINLDKLRTELLNNKIGDTETNHNFTELVFFIFLSMKNDKELMTQYFNNLVNYKFFTGSYNLFDDGHSYYYFSSQIDIITNYIYYFIIQNKNNLDKELLLDEEYYLDQLIKLSNILEYEYKEFGHADDQIFNLITDGIKHFEDKYPKSEGYEYNTYDSWIDLYNPSQYKHHFIAQINNIKREYAGKKSYDKILNMIEKYNFDDSTHYYQLLNSTVDGRLQYQIYDYNLGIEQEILIPVVKDSAFIMLSENSKIYNNENNLLVYHIGWAFHNIYNVDGYNKIYDKFRINYSESNLGTMPLIESLQDFRMVTNPGDRPPGFKTE